MMGYQAATIAEQKVRQAHERLQQSGQCITIFLLAQEAGVSISTANKYLHLILQERREGR